jgi:hypothetical protein
MGEPRGIRSRRGVCRGDQHCRDAQPYCSTDTSRGLIAANQIACSV